MFSLFVDRVHRVPRIWSNGELRKISHHFQGDIVNVSAWRDEDKEGGYYRDYFTNATTYTLTNYRSEARGYQGLEGEIFLDLEKKLDDVLLEKFDVVFNHTALEHIYNVHAAFDNLCKMSRDVVIIVTPFLQQYHADYGDYWRFTPLCLKHLFEDRGYALAYQSFSQQPCSSVYCFTVAVRNLEKWRSIAPDWKYSVTQLNSMASEPYIGCDAITPRWVRLLRIPGYFYRKYKK